MRKLEVAAQKPSSFASGHPTMRNMVKNCMSKIKTAMNRIQLHKPLFFKNARTPVGFAFGGGMKFGVPAP